MKTALFKWWLHEPSDISRWIGSSNGNGTSCSIFLLKDIFFSEKIDAIITGFLDCWLDLCTTVTTEYNRDFLQKNKTINSKVGDILFCLNQLE